MRAVWSTFLARQPGGTERALDILARRFAAGEISQAEFEQAKRALQG
jgi:uncharacterized membrane protein